MSAYLVANAKVTNPEALKKYQEVAVKLMAKYGGEYVFADPNSVSVEGNSEHLTVVLRFPSMDKLQGWYNSPEYQEVLPLRTENSEGIVVFAQD